MLVPNVYARDVGMCEFTSSTSEYAFSRPELSHENLETLALEAMRLIEKRESESENSILGWLRWIEQHMEGNSIHPAEYVALLFIHNSEVFKSYHDPSADSILTSSLLKGFHQLTGKKTDQIQSLPTSVLNKMSLKVNLLHRAVVAQSSGDQRRQTRWGAARQLMSTFSPKSLVNVSIVTLSAVSMLFEPGRSLFFGGLVGLAQASINEWNIHLGIGHAPNWIRNLALRTGGPGRYAREINLSHRVHHAIVAGDYGAAVMTDEQTEQANEVLKRLAIVHVKEEWSHYGNVQKLPNDLSDVGVEVLPYQDMSIEELMQISEFQTRVETLVESIKEGNYGINGTFNGAKWMLITASPFYLANLAYAAATGDIFFLVGSTVSLTAFVLQSLYSHRYMHIRPEDTNKTETNKFQLWYMNTAVGKLQTILHYVHHDMPFRFDLTGNGVIMALSVADYLLDLGVHMATPKHLLELEELGYFEAQAHDHDH